MASLNYSFPEALVGSQFSLNYLGDLEQLAETVGTICGNSTIKAQRLNESIVSIARLYEATNGTADVHAIADLMGTSSNSVSKLQTAFLGAETFKQAILWASRTLPTAPVFPVQTSLLALVIVFFIISYITTGLRLYSRWRLHAKGIRHVDYCLIGALIVTSLISIDFGNNIMVLTHQGNGALWALTYDSLEFTQIHATIETVAYHADILLIKLSILIFYAEMTHPLSYQRMILYFVIFVVVASNLAGFFQRLFRCDPVDYWNAWLTLTCAPYTFEFTFAVGIVNIITDFLIWIMPIPTIFMLQVSRRTQILSLLVIFSSAVAVIFSVLRVHAIWLGEVEVTNGNMADFRTSLYAQVEIHLMIWAYNVPAIRALASWLIRGRTDKNVTSSENSSGRRFFSFGTRSGGSRQTYSSGTATVVDSEVGGKVTPGISTTEKISEEV